jgi:hypothetical protein
MSNATLATGLRLALFTTTNMAVMGGVGVCGSFNLACNINDVAATNCEKCIALKNHLHNLTLELESANLIINLLQ